MSKRKKSKRAIVSGRSEPDRDVGYSSVRVNKILDSEPDRELDHDLVCAIAESARTIGFLHPIAVRRATVKRGSNLCVRTVLVAGAYRLEAARYLHHDRIDCIYIDGDKAFIQLVQIGEDLFRKELTVLRRSELLAKWYKLVSKGDISGQVGQKLKLGRPQGGISKAARDLPMGGSVQARRKMIQRAKKIARLEPRAKQAAIRAGLDDNQQALLAIADTHGAKAQLRKIALLAPPPADRDDEDAEAGDAAKPSTDESPKSRETGASPDHPETSFEQLEAILSKENRALWAYAAFDARAKLFGMLRRIRCKARTDVVKFVRDQFQGFRKVDAVDLYAQAKHRGLSEKAVREALKGLGYQRKRTGHGHRARWYYRNINLDWKEELPVVPDMDATKLREAEEYYTLGTAASPGPETATVPHDRNGEEAHLNPLAGARDAQPNYFKV